MFHALKHAFLGKAGLPATVLSYALIVIAILAMVFGVSGIESRVTDNSRTALSDAGYPVALIESIDPSGRDVRLSGFSGDEEAESQLKEVVKSGFGVRWVCLDNDDRAQAKATSASGQEMVTQATDAQTEQQARQADGQEHVEQEVSAEAKSAGTIAGSVAATAAAVVAANQGEEQAEDAQQAMTSVDQADTAGASVGADVAETGRQAQAVDGGNDDATEAAIDTAPAAQPAELNVFFEPGALRVSGQLPNEEDVQSLTDALQGMNRRGLLSIDVQSGAQPSGLSWARDFLSAVAGIPLDAVGKIAADDHSGVQIVPGATNSVSSGETPGAERASDSVVTTGDAAPDTSMSADSQMVTSPATGEATATVEFNAEGDGGMRASDAVRQAEQRAEDQSVGQSMGAAQSQADFGVDEVQLSAVDQDGSGMSTGMVDYIVGLNHQLSEQVSFDPGSPEILPSLKTSLDQLVARLQQHPDTLLRVVGNVDFSLEPWEGERVGVLRAREVRRYLRQAGLEPFRVFAAPLPRGYAFDPQTQIVFYISE